MKTFWLLLVCVMYCQISKGQNLNNPFSQYTETIQFKAGSNEFLSDYSLQFTQIAKLVEKLVQERQVLFEVSGHTASVGAKERNKALSKLRAEAVANELIEKYNVKPNLLVVIGYGEEKPVATNKSREGRAKNRRIEIGLLLE